VDTSAPGIGILQKSAQNLEIRDGEKSPDPIEELSFGGATWFWFSTKLN
jgi:hypothetical protein